MKKKIKLDLLRPGKWKDRSGKLIDVTKKMIKQIATATKNFSYQNNKFPFTIGHPKDDSPAYGYGDKSKVTVDERGHLQLEASEEDISPELLNLVKEKKFTTISVKTRRDGSIRHVAFLGATPPAVTGLDPVEFSDKDEDGMVFEFSEVDVNDNEEELSVELSEFEVSRHPFSSIQNILRNIKNWFIEEYGKDEADKIFPEHLIEGTGETPRVFTPAKEMAFSEQTNEEDMKLSPEVQAQLDAANNKIAELTGKLDAATTQLSAGEREKKLNSALAFCESDEMKNKIPPAIGTNQVANLLVELEGVGEFEFSEGDETKKVNAADTLKSLLKLLPEFEFSEMATGGASDAESKAAKTIGDEIANYGSVKS